MDFRGHCDSEADNLARLNTPVKTAILPRWQRKALEQQQQQQQQPMMDDITAATPTKAASTTSSGDRFVPNRQAMDVDAAHYHLTANNSAENINGNVDSIHGSPSARQYRQDVAAQLFDGAQGSKILAFKSKAPEPKNGYQNNLRVLYSQNRGAAPSGQRKPTRHIPQTPQRVLDAPDMVDDYYLNLLDWSEENTLAVALNRNVYLWNATTGDINLLMTTADTDMVTSVSWARDGAILAVGTQNQEVQLWDVERQKRLRTMRGYPGRIPSLAWNGNILSCGSRDGSIFHNDVRIQAPVIAQLKHHSQEVCGLKWSPDGSQLASGGNDNLLNIWGGVSSALDQTPQFSLTHHIAAVKALAWCPWQQHLLATGGGTADRHLRLWNTSTGACTAAVDTESQVCSVVWSKEYRELVTSHGVAKNQLTLWRYPTLTKVTELTGHTSRVLHMAISPDGERVATASGDETLRLWHCFASSTAQAGADGSAAVASKAALAAKNARPRDLTSTLSLR